MTRRLGRTEIEAPPVVWRIGGHVDRAMLDAAGGGWVFVPPGNVEGDLRKLKVIVGVEADLLRPRGSAAVESRLKELGLSDCVAIVIQGASADDVKSGWPFHRLSGLREKGVAQLAMIAARNIGDAQWLVENAPAQAVVISHGVGDMTARFRLLDAAKEVGTAILAVRPRRTVWNCGLIFPADDLRFRLGDERITAAIEPLPEEMDELTELRRAIDEPATAAQIDELWKQFSMEVVPPAPLKGGHPPEYGA